MPCIQTEPNAGPTLKINSRPFISIINHRATREQATIRQQFVHMLPLKGRGASDEKTSVITEWLTQCSRFKTPQIKEKVHTTVLFWFIHLKFIVLEKLYNVFSQFKCLCTERYERKRKNESGAQQRGLEI